ncbi:pyruvate ferredoxin oxidoreductase, alpha subunit [Thermanaeromonas toyohensis ToBE]|uniref:Pyruvate ferredoxin oxidoreductase, alpha subunit n=1 Tax=Thermanaeromonas toyohensis ToBE TaxID=698762 RepID=A0A1W1W0Z1_9FIRM|nr:transketolase C-terminal domain-containing protein [Thermanaeromonas toyohensis]SMB99285.1 pyruvate ferredoxin oxidoreductase, alpha subunit [Thermanaeromonas toyohensis ToBE]
MREYLNGNEAVAQAVRLARAEVVAAYPITPQSTIVEEIAAQIARGEMEAEYIRVESEHAALAACFGAAVSGSRVFTATSSQGLAYMFEMLHYVSGARTPMVMAVANRGLAAPWTIWADHQDSISCRDTGWIQLYVETAQEALDTCLQAYKIAEDPQVLTPVMLCLDGYVLSHTEEIVDIPSQEDVDCFLPPYQPQVLVDTQSPVVFGVGAGPDTYPAFKEAQQAAMERAKEAIKRVDEEFYALFGRRYGGLLEDYRCQDAEVILVTLGAITGTAREVVDFLRQEGARVGVLRLRALRPFPVEDLRQALKGARVVAVLDRNCSFGYEGVVCTEVKAALFGLQQPPAVVGFIAGLGGQDIRREDIEGIFRRCLSSVGSLVGEKAEAGAAL